MIMKNPGFAIDAYKIGDQHTEFVVQKFQNKLFIVITQFGKISNLYAIRNQSVNSLMGPDPVANIEEEKIFDIQQKFGSPSIELEGAIRYLINFIKVPQEIIISFGLKDTESINKKILDEIKEVLLVSLKNLNETEQNKVST